MKKLLIIVGVLGTTLLALGATVLVFAQTESPQPFTNSGYGHEMMGGRGRYGGGMAYGEVGSYHEVMLASFAETLGITAEQLEARLEGGETMWQIVESEGATWEEFITIMQQARSTMLEQAVEEGTMSQEQADFMNSRFQGRGFGQGYGGCMSSDGGDQQGYQRGPQGRRNAP
ncbi:MAG: hypothetical protein WA997_11010 [Anaerolineales bacterium]